ncbi:MAG: hypothetical protein IPN26_15775 [Bacteroidetes bacterium]|nr:hypothetical protein [Bacteroidota bacterium]
MGINIFNIHRDNLLLHTLKCFRHIVLVYIALFYVLGVPAVQQIREAFCLQSFEKSEKQDYSTQNEEEADQDTEEAKESLDEDAFYTEHFNTFYIRSSMFVSTCMDYLQRSSFDTDDIYLGGIIWPPECIV